MKVLSNNCHAFWVFSLLHLCVIISICKGHAFSLIVLTIFFFALFNHLLTELNLLFLSPCVSPDEKAWKYTRETENCQDVRKEPVVCPFSEYYRSLVPEETGIESCHYTFLAACCAFLPEFLTFPSVLHVGYVRRTSPKCVGCNLRTCRAATTAIFLAAHSQFSFSDPVFFSRMLTISVPWNNHSWSEPVYFPHESVIRLWLLTSLTSSLIVMYCMCVENPYFSLAAHIRIVKGSNLFCVLVCIASTESMRQGLKQRRKMTIHIRTNSNHNKFNGVRLQKVGAQKPMCKLRVHVRQMRIRWTHFPVVPVRIVRNVLPGDFRIA